MQPGSGGAKAPEEDEMDAASAIVWNAFVDACAVLERWQARHDEGLRAMRAAAAARAAMDPPRHGGTGGGGGSASAAAAAVLAAAPSPRAAAYAAGVLEGARRSPACAAAALDAAASIVCKVARAHQADLEELHALVDDATDALHELPVVAEADDTEACAAAAALCAASGALGENGGAPASPSTPQRIPQAEVRLPRAPRSPAAIALHPERRYALPRATPPLALALSLGAAADALAADCAMKAAVASRAAEWAGDDAELLSSLAELWELQPHVDDGMLERLNAEGVVAGSGPPPRE